MFFSRLSQQHLNLLSLCPRKFQYTYLDQFASPYSPEEEERLNWGNRFHLLMQQRELGLPIDPFMNEDPELHHCFEQLLKTAPEIFEQPSNSDQTVFREAEHSRNLIFRNYIFIVVYDLLIAEEDEAEIIDWKTYPRPQNKRNLTKNWQTRLYPYVLVETSDYSPEQISMTYWFVKSPGKRKSQNLTFPYDEKQHQKNQRELTQLLDQLEAYLDRYEQGEPFPQVDITTGSCTSCQYATRCQRSQENGDEQRNSLSHQLIPDLTMIQEVPI